MSKIPEVKGEMNESLSNSESLELLSQSDCSEHLLSFSFWILPFPMTAELLQLTQVFSLHSSCPERDLNGCCIPLRKIKGTLDLGLESRVQFLNSLSPEVSESRANPAIHQISYSSRTRGSCGKEDA